MDKATVSTIEGLVVRLRPLRSEDLSLTLVWRNQDLIRKWFFHSDPISPEDHQSWFASYTTKEDDLVFIIEDKATRVPVGQVSIYRIDQQKGRGEFGRLMIGRFEARGKGYAKEATKLLLQFAASELHLKEIHLEVYEANRPAVRLYQQCGFVETKRRDGILFMTRSLDAY